jgi:hypothetical protein
VRRAHPRPPLRNVLVAPSNDAEAALARIWRELLGLEEVGVHDNFFEVGGNSLVGTQLAARIRQAFGVRVPLRSLFDTGTIAELAGVIEDLILKELEEEEEQKVGT